MNDKEYQDKCMKEYAEDCNKQLLKDAEIFSQIRALVSDIVYEDIKQSMQDADNAYGFSIVDKPIGNFQQEDYFNELQGQWVDQTTNGGYTGDEFAGTICIQITKDKYFKYHYYM